MTFSRMSSVKAKSKQTTGKGIFFIFTSFLIFLFISSSFVFCKFAESKPDIVYEVVSCKDFLYLCSINIHIPYLVISDLI